MQPDGVRLSYEYDNARRLTAVSNGQGERIEYTLDAMGNRTAENIKATGGAIVKSMTHTYDELGRLLRNIGAASQTTAFAYDKNDNVTSITDPLNSVTAQAYDALDRLIASTDPANGATDYAYDDQDNLTSVTDPRGIATAYVHDGFGRVVQTASADAGTTVYVYDKAGNLIEKTDGRGVVAQYGYDALDRVMAKTFAASPADNVTYEYDDPAPGLYGIGRLRRITDKSGATAFAYDAHGNVVQETRTIAATAYLTSYVYDPADRLTQMVYPSGRIVNYVRGAMGRVVAATTQANASAAPAAIAYNVAYKPFGPIKTMIYGNGLARTYTYDGDYRLTGLVTNDPDTNVQNLTYGYDAADDILSIADAISTARSQTFTYDSLFRLTQATGTYGTVTYGYDAVGNRTSLTQGATSEAYTYDAFSNRLLSVGGGGTRSFTYDNAGNTVSDDRAGGLYELAYDPAGRLSEVDLDGLPESEYRYNALGERVAKQPPGSPAGATHFHYDRDGRLIAESNASGAVIREYAWLEPAPAQAGGLPIGEFTNASGGASPAQVLVDNIDAGASSTGDWSPATAGSGYFGADYDKHEPLSGGVPPGGTTIDNTSADFATTGIWSTATVPAGFEGADYLTRGSSDPIGSEVIVRTNDPGFTATGVWEAQSGGYLGSGYYSHYANQASPQAMVIDNGNAGFTSYGTWSTGSCGSACYGMDFLFHLANQPTPSAVFVDNGTAGAAAVGSWTTRIAGGTYGDTAAISAAGAGENTYTWTPAVPVAGQYKVYVRSDTGTLFVNTSGYATNAPYTVYHDGGATTVTVNQRTGGGKWNLLGVFSLRPNAGQRVVLTNQADGSVSADAIAVSPADDTNKATWIPALPAADQYRVYAWWSANTNRATNAPYTIYHAGGSTTVTVDQRVNGGKWVLLGTFAMSPGQNHRIELSDQADGTVAADAIAVAPVSAPLPMATWAPSLPRRDLYQVYAWWDGISGAGTAPYTIHHDGGVATVLANQSSTPSSWHLLGTYVMAPGQTHRVELGDQTDAIVVIAGAVRFVPAAPKSATWYLTPAQTGTYKVFAKWPAASAQATDAPFTVTHAGGDTTVTANQRLNGGQWNLLGSFTLTAGTRYKVELSDAATGKVAADAIYYVRDTAPTDAFTWTPTLPSAGSWRILVRWPASSGNTASAQYTVTHAGGTTTVTANQKQNGGVWTSLGSYSLTPGAGHKVTLAASTDGATIADAILFAGPTVQPANLLYVHADHLGSPQKLTNTTQATVWDGVFDPFGEEVALTGLAAMPMRFPGQYADEETGFSYNYFRDYDPSIGRYLQSDRFGLRAGTNTYTYVANDPINWFDPFGLHQTNDGTRHIDPFPGGPQGPAITFNNDDPNRPTTDQHVTNEFADMVERAARRTGDNFNINSTTGGQHAPGSRHYTGQACDINEINGNPVNANNPDVDTLQDAFADDPNIRENYGPRTRNEKTESNGQVVQKPQQQQSHPDHIHVSGQQ